MDIADIFQSYTLPPNALPIRCHVLRDEKAKVLEDFLVRQLPGCYIEPKQLKHRVAETSLPPTVILANKLPDPGAVMSGDFGEIVTLYFLSSEHAKSPILIKKWRYKQDRQKSAPHSDVLILCCESPKEPSSNDCVICAESKQKATASTFIPIEEAIEGYKKDKIGRLARTLTWLREKAIEQENAENIELINRFTIDLSVEYSKYFKAVAIVDRAFLDEEITRKIDLPNQDASFEVVVIGINSLQTLYETVFRRAQAEVAL